MKASEFIQKLESHYLFPFSEEEKRLAVKLARTYTGRIVLQHWENWVNLNNSGFTAFAYEFPKIRRNKEVMNHEEENQKTSVPTIESRPQEKEGLVKMMHRKIAENKRKTALPGRIDPKEGWMIGNVPVF